ncbi:anaphase promoting complex subunit 8 [Xylariaceae sp. FL0255]|nr:anaphase promoting complex subunit 8 [Xylariaceae sp. FL0255]
MALTRQQVAKLKSKLQRAVIDCSERCLYHSALWAAELLNSLPDDESDPTANEAGDIGLTTSQRDQSELMLEMRETPKYLMAKTFFDCHEFERCADTLLPGKNIADASIGFRQKKAVSLEHKDVSQRSLFLATYALLILGEKEKTEAAGDILGPSDTAMVVNQQIPRIKSILQAWLDQKTRGSKTTSSEGWLEYLYGMALTKEGSYDLAKTWLVKSVAINPWNWGAWLELGGLINDAKELETICSQLQPTVAAYIFAIFCRRELHQESKTLVSDIEQLQTVFPSSAFLQEQKALVFFNMKEVYAAQTIFSDMLVSNPTYLEFLDHYSDVLFTLKSSDTLAFVAQIATRVEPYRPETCCIVGYYYASLSRKEMAIQYFRLALLLDRHCTPAWRFLGHQYLKLQNWHAAISAYMRAISLDKRD